MIRHGIPFILSVIAPGSGQAHKGRLARGLWWSGICLAWAIFGSIIMQSAMPFLEPYIPSQSQGLPWVFVVYQWIYPMIAISCGVDTFFLHQEEASSGGRWARSGPFVGGYLVLLVLVVPILSRQIWILRYGPEMRRYFDAQQKTDVMARQILEGHSPTPAVSSTPAAYKVSKDGITSRYGAYFPVPVGYKSEARSAPNAADIELLLIYPASLAQAPWDDGGIDRGALALDVVPLLDKEKKDSQYREKFESQLKKVMEGNGWRAAAKWEEGFALPALVVRVEQPRHVRVMLFGKERLYKFMAKELDGSLNHVLTGFREAP